MERRPENYAGIRVVGNELLWLVMLAANFAGILIVYRFFGKLGLYAWIPMAAIIANIQVLKTVEIFGVTATLGNIVYATSFLATDILSENYGRRDAGKAVAMGFIALASLTAFMSLSLLFKPAPEDFAQESLVTLFRIIPRITLASFVAYGTSQFHDIWAYGTLKRRRPDPRWIWLRNNLSTLVSQLIDTVVFTAIAFAGIYTGSVFLEIVVTTYILKVIVAATDTPLVYLAQRWKARGKIGISES